MSKNIELNKSTNIKLNDLDSYNHFQNYIQKSENIDKNKLFRNFGMTIFVYVFRILIYFDQIHDFCERGKRNQLNSDQVFEIKKIIYKEYVSDFAWFLYSYLTKNLYDSIKPQSIPSLPQFNSYDSDKNDQIIGNFINYILMPWINNLGRGAAEENKFKTLIIKYYILKEGNNDYSKSMDVHLAHIYDDALKFLEIILIEQKNLTKDEKGVFQACTTQLPKLIDASNKYKTDRTLKNPPKSDLKGAVHKGNWKKKEEKGWWGRADGISNIDIYVDADSSSFSTRLFTDLVCDLCSREITKLKKTVKHLTYLKGNSTTIYDPAEKTTLNSKIESVINIAKSSKDNDCPAASIDELNDDSMNITVSAYDINLINVEYIQRYKFIFPLDKYVVLGVNSFQWKPNISGGFKKYSILLMYTIKLYREKILEVWSEAVANSNLQEIKESEYWTEKEAQAQAAQAQAQAAQAVVDQATENKNKFEEAKSKLGKARDKMNEFIYALIQLDFPSGPVGAEEFLSLQGIWFNVQSGTELAKEQNTAYGIKERKKFILDNLIKDRDGYGIVRNVFLSLLRPGQPNPTITDINNKIKEIPTANSRTLLFANIIHYINTLYNLPFPDSDNDGLKKLIKLFYNAINSFNENVFSNIILSDDIKNIWKEFFCYIINIMDIIVRNANIILDNVLDKENKLPSLYNDILKIVPGTKLFINKFFTKYTTKWQNANETNRDAAILCNNFNDNVHGAFDQYNQGEPHLDKPSVSAITTLIKGHQSSIKDYNLIYYKTFGDLGQILSFNINIAKPSADINFFYTFDKLCGYISSIFNISTLLEDSKITTMPFNIFLPSSIPLKTSFGNVTSNSFGKNRTNKQKLKRTNKEKLKRISIKYRISYDKNIYKNLKIVLKIHQLAKKLKIHLTKKNKKNISVYRTPNEIMKDINKKKIILRN